jgi:FAD/FMN-containing dehydrogenase
VHGSERNMKQQFDTSLFIQLAASLEGEFFYDDTMRTLYATDASVYKEYPLAVCYPKTKKDIQALIQFAHQHKTSLIPRTAGTSLGGQVVGGGIVVDVSKYFDKILEVNKDEKYCIVQPGVVRDELNRQLKSTGIVFCTRNIYGKSCDDWRYGRQ